MLPASLASLTRCTLRALVGEQFADEQRGHTQYFSVWWNGVRVTLIAHPISTTTSLVTGVNVIGVGITDSPAASGFVAAMNHEIRCGRLDLTDNTVIFTDFIVDAGVNKTTVRFLLNLLAESASWLPELASRAGALSPADIALISDDDI